jgi:hypothetical protein
MCTRKILELHSNVPYDTIVTYSPFVAKWRYKGKDTGCKPVPMWYVLSTVPI